MKKVVFAAAMLVLASTAAMADDMWVMQNDYTCHIPQSSLGGIFRLFSQAAAVRGYPQPQIDYTSGTAIGLITMYYTSPSTGKPSEMLFFDSRALCEAARARIAAGNVPSN